MLMTLKINQACPKMYSYDFFNYSKDYIGEVMLESVLTYGDVFFLNVLLSFLCKNVCRSILSYKIPNLCLILVMFNLKTWTMFYRK